jgi:hypothetical protein
MATSSPERITARIEWGSGEGMRAEKRIRRQMYKVLWYCFQGYTLSQVARLTGMPGLSTMKRWCAENLYGFGRDYRLYRVEHEVAVIEEGLEADLTRIRERAARHRNESNPDRSRTR